MLSPDSLFGMLHGITVAGDTLLDGHSCLVLQGLEPGPDDLPLTAQLFVDQELWLVRGLRTLMGANEVFHLHIEYLETAPGIHMPRQTRLKFQLNELFLRGRHGPPGSFDPDAPTFDIPEDVEMAGEATIIFSNYRINHGIPDSYFEEEKPPSD